MLGDRIKKIQTNTLKVCYSVLKCVFSTLSVPTPQNPTSQTSQFSQPHHKKVTPPPNPTQNDPTEAPK